MLYIILHWFINLWLCIPDSLFSDPDFAPILQKLDRTRKLGIYWCPMGHHCYNSNDFRNASDARTNKSFCFPVRQIALFFNDNTAYSDEKWFIITINIITQI